MANFPKRDFNKGKDFKGSRDGGRERSFDGRDRGARDDRKSFGSSDFKKKSFGGDWNKGGSREDVTMHKAVCGECGNNCEVPFRPSQDKPVFCRDCFSTKREGPSERNPNKRNYVERDRKDSVTPTFSAPVPAMSEDVKRKFEMLTVKIDNLSYIVEKMIEEKKVSATTVVEKPVSVKKETVKKVEIKKVSVAAPVKVAVAKAVTKKVVAKVATKAVVAKTVAVKKAVAKSAPVKKVVAKAVTKKVVAKVATKVVSKK